MKLIYKMAGKFKKKSNNSFANKISTLANVVEVPPPILASFDKASDKNSTPPSYLAAVLQAIDQHRLKIWDVKTSVLIGEYSPKQVDCRYTSLTWGESVEVTEIESDVNQLLFLFYFIYFILFYFFYFLFFFFNILL